MADTNSLLGGTFTSGGSGSSGGGSGGGSNQGSGSGLATANTFNKTNFANQLGATTQNAFNQGYAVNPELQYAGLGTQTTNALNGLYDAAGVAGSGVGAANAANTALINSDPTQTTPAFESVLNKSLADAGNGVNAALGANGRYGSNVHVNTLASTLGNVSDTARLGEYRNNLARQDAAIGNAGTLFQNALAPYQSMLGVGQAFDADRQANITAKDQLFRQQNDAGYNQIARFTSALSGQPQQQEQQNPWLQGLGIAGSLASIFL